MFLELKTFNQKAAAREAKTQALEESVQTIEEKTNTILSEYFLSFITDKFSDLTFALFVFLPAWRRASYKTCNTTGVVYKAQNQSLLDVLHVAINGLYRIQTQQLWVCDQNKL